MSETKPKATSLAALLSVLVLCTAPSAYAADGVGLRVVRDPVTGQLRAPTAEEATAMDERDAAARAAQPAAAPATGAAESAVPMEFRQSNGVRYRVGDTFLSYSVVKRSADGTLDLQCVTGEEAALKLLKAPQSATAKPAKGADHAH